MMLLIAIIIAALLMVSGLGAFLAFRIKMNLKRKHEKRFMKKMGYDSIGYS